MALQWVLNTTGAPKFIGGKLCLNGEGNWVDYGPLVQPSKTPAQLYEAEVAAGLGKTFNAAQQAALQVIAPALLAAAGKAAVWGFPVLTPVGFRWTTHPLSMRRGLDGVIRSDWLITDYMPAVTTTYYVDPVSGSDANAGTSRALPLKNLATALAKTDVDQIRIINLTADFIGRTTQSWNNVQPTRSVSVIVEGPYRYISAAVSSSAAPTWAVNGTYPLVYQSAFATANSHAVTDVSSKTVPSYVDPITGLTVTGANVPPRYRTYVKVADLATVAATPGSWFNDGTNTYVRPFDDRNLVGDTKVLVTTNGNNGRFPSVNNCTIYVQGLDFIGGRPWYSLCASTVTGTVFAHNNCSFQGGGVVGGYNGLNIAAFQTVIGYRSAAYDNGADGFNYHSNESDGTTPNTSPNWLEIECWAAGNGTTGSAGTSDNASTSHDFCSGIRLNGAYLDSNDRVVADTNSAHTWNLACYVGPAVTTTVGNENCWASLTSKMWLDSMILKQGAGAAGLVNADTSAVVYAFNCGTLANAAGATGTLRSYVA